MSLSVFGSHKIAIGSNRVRVPAKYRSFLGDDIIATAGSDGCFLLMPAENREKVLSKYVKIDDPYMSKYKDMARAINTLTAKIELDGQDRITIDEQLKKICTGLKTPTEAIVFCGMGDYIEAWPQHVYDKKYGGDLTSDNFDDLIANLKAQLGKEN